MRLGWCASIYRLPSCVELQDDATLLADLVRFTLHPEGFRLPADWKRSFQLVRCADFFFGGGGGWTVSCSLWPKTLRVETTALNNAIRIRLVRHLLRSKYRSASHRAEKYAGKPVVLHQPG